MVLVAALRGLDGQLLLTRRPRFLSKRKMMGEVVPARREKLQNLLNHKRRNQKLKKNLKQFDQPTTATRPSSLSSTSSECLGGYKVTWWKRTRRRRSVYSSDYIHERFYHAPISDFKNMLLRAGLTSDILPKQ